MTKDLKTIKTEIASLRRQVSEINKQIEGIIVEREPELKNKLKGDQITAFVGEFYASRLLEAKIERDEMKNYDLVMDNLERVEVKTRSVTEQSLKNNSFVESSTICFNNNDNDPTKLCFVLINGDDYSLNAVWLYDVFELQNDNRIKANKKKKYMRINLTKDIEKLIYPCQLNKGKWGKVAEIGDAFVYNKKKNKTFQKQVVPNIEKI